MAEAALSFLSFDPPAKSNEPRELFAHCPSCSKQGWFSYQGVQRWSESVAAACGLPSAMRMWTCEHCHTTLCEPNLRR
jgi:hypothetical protein